MIRLYILACLSSLLIFCNTSDSPDQKAVSVLPDDEKEAVIETGKKVILFYGNSLTAGYGLDEEQSFPSLIQQRIDSMGLPFTVINGGLSGETTAGGVGRIDWVLKQPIDLFVLELGGNDMLRGLSVKESYSNLEKILQSVRATYPEIPIIIAGMQSPPNMGQEYASAFDAMYPKLAQAYEADLIPFLLDNVAKNPDLNLPDGIHPNATGQKIVRENVWEILYPVMQKMLQ